MNKVHLSFLTLCIVLAMLFTLSGCDTSTPVQDNAQDSVEQTNSNKDEELSEGSYQEAGDDGTPSTDKGEQISPEVLYAPILEKYRTTLSQEDPGFSRGQGYGEVNYLCMYHDPSEIGYTFMDTNQDGTPELLIGPIGSDTSFFDLYTVVEGIPILVAQSGERDWYYVCTDGTIANEGSYSAFGGIHAYYTIGEQGQRILSEAVMFEYNEYNDTDTYWYSTSSTSTDGAEEVTWESAELIYKKYEYITIDYTTPFILGNSLEPAQAAGSKEPPTDTVIERFLAGIIPRFIAIPGTDMDFEWDDDSYESGVATVYPQSAQPEAFSVSGYINMAMVRLNEENWVLEIYEDQCSISYNYADEYFDDAHVRGFCLNSTVEFGNGNAWTTITPIDYGILYAGLGTDPTGDDLTCYWDYSDGSNSDAAYTLQDEAKQIVVYFDAQMMPISFDFRVFE